MNGTDKESENVLGGEPVRLLVIAGDSAERTILRAGLEGHFSVAGTKEASTLAESRDLLAAAEFDLCLVDLELPDGDGWAIAQWLRDRERREAIVFLASGAALSREAIPGGLETEELVLKDAGLGLLLRTSVRRALERRQLLAHSNSLQRRLARAEELASLNTLLVGIAHNLNNPLTTIRTFLELLPERYDRDPEFRTDYYQLVLSELERIRALVRSVAQTMALPVGEGEQGWSLPELLGELELYVRPGASEKDVSLDVRADGDFGPMPAEREAIKQALVILLDNAVAFSPEKGCVELVARSSGPSDGSGWVHLEVSDQGDGVAEEHRGKVFEPFFSTRTGGLGIGLFVARSVARAHGGSLEVAGRAPRGAVFTLTLPVG